MSWGWLNEEQVYLVDPNNPRIITMDPWPQLIFIHADGTKSVKEFIEWLAGEYKRSIPETLIGDVIELIETLRNDEKTIVLRAEKKTLPEEFLNATE